MGAPNHLIAGGWHQSDLPTMLWEASLLETLATSQQLGWQESRIPFVLSSSPISISALLCSDKLFYSSLWGIARETLEAWFCSLFWVMCQVLGFFLQLKTPDPPSVQLGERDRWMFLSWTE